MKKIFMVFALMAMLMLPFTSFSMTAMEEGDLSSVTGQAGVSINLDARVDLKADTVAWGDMDGFTAPNVTVTSGPDAAGWVGLDDLVVDNLRIRADQTLLNAQWFEKHTNTTLATNFKTAAADYLTAATNITTQYAAAYPADTTPTAAEAVAYSLGAYATAASDPTPTIAEALAYEAAHPGTVPYSAQLGAFGTAKVSYDNATAAVYAVGTAGSAAFLQVASEKGAGMFTPFAPLTIDVATDATTNHGGVAGVTFVRIGLGSLQVEMASMNTTVELGRDTGYVGNGTGVANGVPSLQFQLGSLYLGTMSLRIGGNSYVDIFNARGGTAQGVSIAANVIIKEFSIGTLAWGDADGIDWSFSTDSEGVYGLHTTVDNLITADGTNYADQGWVGLKDLNIDWLQISGLIDIDVATDDALGTYTGNANWTYVDIGLTNLKVNMSGLTTTAALGATKTNLNQELGELYISNAEIIVNGDIALGARSNGTQGVTLDLSNVTVSISQGLTVSWGDLDGVGGTSAAGYVGLTGLNINGLALQGKVTIDVASIRSYDPDTTSATTIEDMMYLGYVENNLSPTIVHIGLGTGNANNDTMDASFAFLGDALGVSITSLSGAVAFAPVQNLVGAKTLGNLYLGGVKLGINGWVDIAAH